MRTGSSWFYAALAISAGLAGCDSTAPISGDIEEHPAQVARSTVSSSGELYVGAAEVDLHLPVGIPLAAYTGRLDLFNPYPDDRTSPYTTEFAASAGIQTRAPAKVVWLRNGDTNTVLVKLDIAYCFDGLLFEVQEAISAATGVDVNDHVLLATSHSHSSWGDFSNDAALYLGSDQFNTEVMYRMVDHIVYAAEQAFADLQPGAIGVGFDPEFDPNGVDEIYRDRRSENDTLTGVDGEVLGHGYKDPRLTVIRIDHSKGTATTDDDEPVALIHNFPMHGTIMGEDNALVSVEGTGHITRRVAEQFNQEVVVMHLQGSAGDISPAGFQDDFARMETLAERATPKIMDLYDGIETATGDITVELLTRSIHQYRDDMHITRQGSVDYFYTRYSERYHGDDIVYDENGVVISPIDEFNSLNGAALCDGSEDMLFVGKLFGWGSEVPPYNTCANVDPILKLMDIPLFDFDMSWTTLPLKSALSTVISVMRIDSVPVHVKDETRETAPVVFGIFPGEPVTLYGDTFKKSVEDIYGYHYAVPIGYAQDHEGYLLTLEDWLAGGYEPEINQWGPIQAEYILEQTVELVSQFGIDDPSVPASSIPHPDQSEDFFPFDPVVPDITPEAGQRLSRVPSYLYTFNDILPISPQPPQRIQRLKDFATFVWMGGDPAVDSPTVTLERESRPGSGEFTPVLHPSGRPWSEAGPEILLTYTPDPLKDRADQTHYWMAIFQPVLLEPTIEFSAGLPLGEYRFRVDGAAVLSDPGEYPWNTTGYTIYSEPFEVTALAEIDVATIYSNGTLQITASYPIVEQGFRLISMNTGDENEEPSPLCAGPNPQARGTVALYDDEWVQVWQSELLDFTTNWGSSSVSVQVGNVEPGEYHVVVTDVFGNSGDGDLIID